MTTLLDQYEAFAIDLDGVVWRGDSMLPGAVEALSAIQDARKPILLLTNNGAYTEDEVKRRLGRQGMSTKGIAVLTSVLVAIRWVESEGLTGATAAVLAPVEVVTQLSHVLKVKDVASGELVEVVIVGRDTGFDYSKLTWASDSVRKGAALIALNRDLTLPVETGFVPGTGALVVAIEAASGAPAIVLGKPHAPMMKMAKEILGTNRVLLVGDRVDSDIAGAISIGWDSALVLSGVTDTAEGLDPSPSYVIDSLSALVNGGHYQGAS